MARWNYGGRGGASRWARESEDARAGGHEGQSETSLKLCKGANRSGAPVQKCKGGGKRDGVAWGYAGTGVCCDANAEGRAVRLARPRMSGQVIHTRDRLGRHAVPTLPRGKRLTKGGQPYPWQLCRDAVPTLPMAEGA